MRPPTAPKTPKSPNWWDGEEKGRRRREKKQIFTPSLYVCYFGEKTIWNKAFCCGYVFANPDRYIWFISYTSFAFISFTGTYVPTIDLQLSWLEHRTGIARSRVQTPLKSWICFQVSLRNCINYVYNCEDHLSFDLCLCCSLFFWSNLRSGSIFVSMANLSRGKGETKEDIRAMVQLGLIAGYFWRRLIAETIPT